MESAGKLMIAWSHQRLVNAGNPQQSIESLSLSTVLRLKKGWMNDSFYLMPSYFLWNWISISRFPGRKLTWYKKPDTYGTVTTTKTRWFRKYQELCEQRVAEQEADLGLSVFKAHPTWSPISWRIFYCINIYIFNTKCIKQIKLPLCPLFRYIYLTVTF